MELFESYQLFLATVIKWTRIKKDHLTLASDHIKGWCVQLLMKYSITLPLSYEFKLVIKVDSGLCMNYTFPLFEKAFEILRKYQ